MGSEINKLLGGLYQGGLGLASGLIDKADKNKPKDYFESERNYLAGTFKKSMDSAGSILDPHPEVTPGTVSPVQTDPGTTGGTNSDPNSNPLSPADINNLYARREKGITDLQSMKYGAPYAESLNRLYQDTLSPKSPWEFKEGKDGEFFAINKNTFETRKLTNNAPKEKEFTTKNWEIFQDESGKPYYGERTNKNGKVEIEFRDDLNKTELDDWNYENELKAKKLAPPVRTGRGGRGFGGPKKEKPEPLTFASRQLESKIKDYANLKLKDDMTEEEKEKFKDLGSEIQKLSGEDADNLSDRLINSTDMNEDLKSIQESKAQEGEVFRNIDQIKKEFQSGQYDNDDLKQNAYDWLGSLFNSGIDRSVLDKIYKEFNDWIAAFEAAGGYIAP